MTDKALRNSVLQELDFEPSVDASDIGVTVDDGVVTLTGRVADYAQKLAAEEAARRVKGVKAIVQELDVKPAHFDSDESLAHRALSVIDWNVSVPSGAVQVRVAHGMVTLSGQVEWAFQRHSAEEAVRKLGGVTCVINNITLKSRVQPVDVRRRIVDALDRYADLEASGVSFDVVDGKVTLRGRVKSWAERGVIERAAWSAPGVRTVEDHVTVGP